MNAAANQDQNNVVSLYQARIERKERKTAESVAELVAANSHLQVAGDSLTTAAKNIRIELKKAFAGVKFSVKTKRFSMGDSINVSWVDGPTTKQVDAIVDKYASGTFDSMTDCSGYCITDWNRAFGEAKYVSTSRDFSVKLMAATAEHVAGIYGAPVPVVEASKYDGNGVMPYGTSTRIERCKLHHYMCDSVQECTMHVLHKLSR